MDFQSALVQGLVLVEGEVAIIPGLETLVLAGNLFLRTTALAPVKGFSSGKRVFRQSVRCITPGSNLFI